MNLQQGALIGGRYRLEQSIGSGGMGEVFRAVDSLLGRPVAVKLVNAVEPRKRREVTESFLREARISAAIAHPNVVQILDFGIHKDEAPFIVMELLAGESLADMLGRGVSMPIGFVFDLMIRVLDAIKAAHLAGVIHRDLKPENIFLTRERGGLSPKLLDFGISKILDATGVAHVTTTHGHIVGTPAYMSPEQARGLKEIDQRTDLYSMGVVLYELLSGELPFFSENPGDLLVMIMTEREQTLGERVPELAGTLSDLVQRAMAKNPEERFRDAGEMLDALSFVARSFAQRQPSHAARSVRSAGRTTSPPLSLVPPVAQLGIPVSAEASGPPRSRGWLLLGLPLIGAAFVAGFATLRGLYATPPSAPRFIVVQANPRSTPDAPRAQSPSSSLSPARADSPAPSADGGTRGKRSSSTSPAEALAQSFRAQRAAIVRCVNTHPDEVERTPNLTLRLSVSVAGEVSEVHLFPAELAARPVSACIEGAARQLKFPRQAAPMVFDIPLTARKGG